MKNDGILSKIVKGASKRSANKDPYSKAPSMSSSSVSAKKKKSSTKY